MPVDYLTTLSGVLARRHFTANFAAERSIKADNSVVDGNAFRTVLVLVLILRCSLCLKFSAREYDTTLAGYVRRVYQLSSRKLTNQTIDSSWSWRVNSKDWSEKAITSVTARSATANILQCAHETAQARVATQCQATRRSSEVLETQGAKTRHSSSNDDDSDAGDITGLRVYILPKCYGSWSLRRGRDREYRRSGNNRYLR
jgi:hypothetical protein